MRTLSFVSRAAAVCGIALMVLACGQGSPPEQVAAPAVTVVKVTAEDIRPMSTFTGRIEAMDKVDLRARVDGFLEKRLFTEGSRRQGRRPSVRDREGPLPGRGRRGAGRRREGGGGAQARRHRGRAPDRVWSSRTSRRRPSSTRSRQAGRGARRDAGGKSRAREGEAAAQLHGHPRPDRRPHRPRADLGRQLRSAASRCARHHRQPGSDLRQLPGHPARDPRHSQSAWRTRGRPRGNDLSCGSPTAAATPSPARSISSTSR